ncbi:MAG: ribosome silencing factor [Lactobacillus sp.]|nr:ribosome silencing factor [Lactobacillus sp.]
MNKQLEIIAEAISDRHGEDTVAYNMQGISILADYYVITTAGSNRQLHAIANSVIDACQENDIHYRIEGTRDSDWLLIDAGDVVVNIFTNEARAFYNLEKLWSEGEEIRFED